MKKDELDFLQDWFQKNCNADWEHEFGISIETIDNPGWNIVIDLTDTELKNKQFEEVNFEYEKNNWIQCAVKDGQFIGFGGPKNLKDIINVFIQWKEKN